MYYHGGQILFLCLDFMITTKLRTIMRRRGCRVMSHNMHSLRCNMISYYTTCNCYSVNRSRFQISLICVRTGGKQVPYPTSAQIDYMMDLFNVFYCTKNTCLTLDPYCMNHKSCLLRHGFQTKIKLQPVILSDTRCG